MEQGPKVWVSVEDDSEPWDTGILGCERRGGRLPLVLIIIYPPQAIEGGLETEKEWGCSSVTIADQRSPASPSHQRSASASVAKVAAAARRNSKGWGYDSGLGSRRLCASVERGYPARAPFPVRVLPHPLRLPSSGDVPSALLEPTASATQRAKSVRPGGRGDGGGGGVAF